MSTFFIFLKDKIISGGKGLLNLLNNGLNNFLRGKRNWKLLGLTLAVLIVCLALVICQRVFKAESKPVVISAPKETVAISAKLNPKPKEKSKYQATIKVTNQTRIPQQAFKKGEDLTTIDDIKTVTVVTNQNTGEVIGQTTTTPKITKENNDIIIASESTIGIKTEIRERKLDIVVTYPFAIGATYSIIGIKIWGRKLSADTMLLSDALGVGASINAFAGAAGFGYTWDYQDGDGKCRIYYKIQW
ncbi:MAG TPA: hypothetical protein DDW65_21585 [Firmicutes bacterium]|nr:hypothetical protein [Bacillota bacterium]